MSADVSEVIDQVKYWAFISYSQRDKKWGDWLHKALETYRVPRRLVGKESREGKVPRRVFPIFRDREELPVSADLSSNIEQALRDSRHLIVICSPRSAQSRWVSEEIKIFKKLGREDRILALIIDGEPNASDKLGFSPEDESFPEALRYRLADNGELSEIRTEPIAADAREGKDGKTNAKLKLLAGLLGVNYDDLKRREQRRVLRRRLVTGTAALVVLALAGSWAWQEMKQLYGKRKISANHAPFGENCASCHDKSLAYGSQTLAKLKLLVSDPSRHGLSFNSIDQKCEICHAQHTLHEPNVVQNRSCSDCHQEHQGPVPMKLVASSNCASCHNDSKVMQASADRGKQLAPTRFHLNPKMVNFRQVALQLPRPTDGYTKTFASFSEGHPPFQLQRENVRDTNVLLFNHMHHLSSDIPPTKGSKLDCNYCHQPEPNGEYMRPISFEAHCQECHSLQFDVRNPDFQLPHGDPQLVRTFLRTLPVQYAELARRSRGLTNETEINEFAGQQVRQLLTQFRNAEELERSVFSPETHTDARKQTMSAVALITPAAVFVMT